MQQTVIRADLSELERILRELGGTFVARVGILGSNAGQKHPDGDLTNAEIGVIQEFGSVSRNIPPRSFLRMPIERKTEYLVQRMGVSRVRDAMNQGDIFTVYKILGIAAEGVVKDAFSSRGYGTWKANASSTVAAKGSDAPLIDTGQLRRSISSDVRKKSEVM